MRHPLPIAPGDRVILKKPHACGADAWEILRIGADIRARCLGCGRIITMGRWEFEGRIRRVTSGAEAPPPRDDDI